MSNKKDQTASFVVRFTQQIFEDTQGQSDVQWKGKISHVQSDDEKRFTDVSEALSFMQARLADMTKSSTEHVSKDEQKGLLNKSLGIWKRVSKEYPKFVMDTIKDPKAQVEHIQGQIQEGLHQVSEGISEKLELNEWQPASKSDYKNMMEMMTTLTTQVSELSKKVDTMSKKSKA